MANRPGAAVVTGGALLALLCPGVATADALPREVTGGYATLRFENPGISLNVAEPAVRGSADQVRFPATGGAASPETGDTDVELGGTALLTSAAGKQLPLSGLTLRLAGDTGTLHTRTVVAGQARELDLADVTSGAEPVVRSSGLTWTGLGTSLTDDGAALLSEWSGAEFATGDAFGVLDVTVGTGSTAAEDIPRPAPTPTATPTEQKEAVPEPMAPTATVTHSALAPGAEQQVTGEGFEPGEVVLVSIDQDTRYQAVADERGQVSRAFPVYGTAVEGAHTVELYTVTGERGAVAEFGVRAPE
ncbi:MULTISPECIES: HtaA domain-containing protein [unclassified Streptomyces]|uniref:HtaA domain-containing protein n=1 Tax=unclassified Streptomyces TaxID=2593676 RepID=UPI00225517EA|nr:MULTISPECIES: HtaA domain-containing protein [unclassified Streptomyces]MCX5332717.1 HtaA domain-containing protein [Streptomyces sp. NBC_00140]MCX5362115.1 HtaA domain-containing protein [Streptomyces sp. NBC_00124]